MIDIFGIELLNHRLQQSLEEIKIESFIFNGRKTEINSIYLKFDNWISLFFDDGVLFIKEGLGNKQRRIESDGNIIEYLYLDTINAISDINSVINKRLTSVMSDDNGLKLTFENLELKIYQELVAEGEFGRTLIEIQ